MQGIKIGKEEVKLALFANDLSCFVKNYTSSYEQLTSSLENFALSLVLKLTPERLNSSV